MPAVGSVQPGAVTAAISRAAARTGVDFNYLMAQAKIESGLNPRAQADTSSARGLYQFVDATWLRTVDKHGAKHGMGWADEAITAGRIGDPSLRAEVMALRDNPDAAALMAAELALDNGDGLRATLGREPDNNELYLAHFLGLGGAQTFLGALAADPGRLAEQVNPAAARANRGIFYNDGRARSVGEVMEVIRAKMATASGGAFESPSSSSEAAGFAAMRLRYAPPRDAAFSSVAEAAAGPASMADTLRSTFGNGNELGTRAGAQVAAAYNAFRTFAL